LNLLGQSLTHNFDFYRTLENRFVEYKQCFMAFKESNGLVFRSARAFKNVFVKEWKGNFFSNGKQRIASMPFMRNLVEYTRGKSDPQFQELTSLLYWKSPATEAVTEADLDAIYNSIISTSSNSFPNPSEPV